MTDRYNILDNGTSSHDRLSDPLRDGASITTEWREHSGAPTGWVRPVLWVLLVVFLSGNVVTQAVDLHVLVSGGFGLAALATIAALVVHHYRHRSS